MNITDKKAVVNILRLSSVAALDPAIDVALEAMRTQPDPALRAAFDRLHFNVVRKSTQRRATLNVRDTLRVAVDSLSHNPYNNTCTFGLILGPDFSEEAEFVAQLAPMYNVITLSASASSDTLSNMDYYPLLFRAGLGGTQVLDATVKVARMTGVRKMAAIAIDEAYARERMQQLVGALRGSEDAETSVEFAITAIITKSNINAVLQELATQQPYITLATTLDKRGGQIVCDAYLLGLSPVHTVWMFGGPFVEEQWWLPPSPAANVLKNSMKYYNNGWNCTLNDTLVALNGSFVVDHKVVINLADDSVILSEEQQRQRRRLDGKTNVELQQMFRNTANNAGMSPPINGTFMMYDTVWAMAIALQRVNDRMTTHSVTMSAAANASYFSPEYMEFSSILKEELRNTSFYGATGLVEFDDNHARRGLVISIQQFQSDASTKTGRWVVVGEVNAASNTSFLDSSRLRFGAHFGKAPYDPNVNRSDAEIAAAAYGDPTSLAMTYSRVAVFLPISILTLVFLVAVVVLWWFYKSRARKRAPLLRSESLNSNDSAGATVALDILINRSRLTNLESVFTQTTSLADVLNKKLSAADGGYRHNKNKRSSMHSRRSALFAAAASSASTASYYSQACSSAVSSSNSSYGNTGSLLRSIDDDEDFVRYLRRKRTQIGRLDLTVNVWVRDFVLQRYVPPVASAVLAIPAKEASSLSGISRFQRSSNKPPNDPQWGPSALLASSIVVDIHRLTHVAHENVNKMHGLILYDEKERMATGGMQGAVLFQRQQSGSLFDVLHNDEIKLDNVMKYLFIRDIVNGLSALHAPSLNIPHGFLHTRNVVIDRRYTVLLTDYGLGFLRSNVICSPLTAERVLELENNPKIDILLHMYLNRAPELLRDNNKKHWPPQCGTLAGDVYSVAMMAVEILTRQLPFADSAIYGMDRIGSLVDALFLILFDRIVVRRPPCDGATFSPPLKALLTKCWHEDPALRPNIASVQRELPKLPGFEHAAGSIVENLVMRLESYANNLEQIVNERTQALADEIAKSEQLLLQILPRTVADALKRGQRVVPESFESVSVYFSDIVGFTSLSARSTPMQVVAVLNKLYTMFDSTIEQFRVYKVETIGDAYMVASGLPVRNGTRHCIEIARMSLTLLDNMRTFEVPHAPGELLTLRVGLHCGPCAAGVVGIKMPRYCLFGDTVNFASRMESNGEAYKIHTSSQYYEYVQTHYPNTYDFQCRGEIDIKGKGKTITYWLVAENFTPDVTISPASQLSIATNARSNGESHATGRTSIPRSSITSAIILDNSGDGLWLKSATRKSYSRKASPTPSEQGRGLICLNQPGSVETCE